MDQKGLIFNIQKFSIHDGPGIRTTVFLKGCPLRCRWCANPESQSSLIQTMNDNTEAGEYKTVSQVLEICLQDMDFYLESGGGVTISGGEGMMQPDFVEALVKKLKEAGIHTAIETTGYVKEEIFQRLAPLFDLLLFDVKHYDRKKHFLGTGVYNDRIISNLSWAAEQGLTILPRIPVIPDFNDSPEDAKGLAALLKKIVLKEVQLLPFHQMGERKYELLDRDYAYTGVKALHPEDLEDYQAAFKDLRCFF